MTDIIVLDVSHWQGKWPGPSTPWAAMARNGIVGVILKATEGTSYVDNTFRKRYDACIANGIAVASYHFLRHGSIEDQMANYFETVQPRLGERMVLDWEDPAVTADELRKAAAILLDSDIEVAVYGSSSFLTEHLAAVPNDILARTSLWVARYSSQEPYWPKDIWPTWSLWQCTDQFMIEGYGPLDGNKFNGSVENCIAWLNPSGSKPAPGPEPEAKAVNIQITATEGVTVYITVNGEVISL